MWTIPNCLLVRQILGNGFQDELLPHLPRDAVQADGLAIPWILFLALLEARSDICSPPVHRHLSQLP